MEEKIHDLTAILDEEITIYRELLQLAKNKQKTLLDEARELQTIEAINAREVQLAQEIANAEKRRLQIMDDLASHQGSHSPALTLMDLAQLLGAPADQYLLERREAISNLLAELKELNAFNKKILEQELAFIDFSLNLFTGETGRQGYSPAGGKQKAATGRSFLDWKA